MSYHSPVGTFKDSLDKLTTSGAFDQTQYPIGKSKMGFSNPRARMPSMSTSSTGNMSTNVPKTQQLKADKAGIYMDELGIATAAEKNKRGYLSTYLEGQTAPNKISNWLKGSL